MTVRRCLALAVLAGCSSSAPTLDVVTLASDKATVLANSTDKATLALSARSSSNGKLPAGSKITLTTTAGFIDTVGTTSKEFAVTGTGGEFTASLFCDADANATVKASTGSASRSLSITCGNGAGGTTSGTTGATTGTTTGTTTSGPTGPSGPSNLSAVTLVAQNKLIATSSTTVLTATLVGTGGNPVANVTPVVFTTTLGTFQVSNTATLAVDSTAAGVATAVLQSPAATSGNADVSASFVDSLGVSRSATVSVRIVSGSVKNIILEPTATTLNGVGTKATITGTLYNGAAPFDAGATISVSLSGPSSIGSLVVGTGGGTLASDARSISAIDNNSAGVFTFDFFTGFVGGSATLTVTYDGGTPATSTTELLTLNVIGPPGLAGAQFKDAVPADLRIRARGSIAPNVATVRFLFTDAQGQPIPDGQPVDFSLPGSATNEVFLTPPSTTTTDGVATVFVNAGAQAETVTVTAKASRNGVTVQATSPGIAIVGGVPEYSHLSWSCKTDDHIVAGLALDGLDSKCTLQVADRFSNRVDVGTRVSFRSEAGNINASAVVTSDETSPDIGSALAVLRTAEPRPRLFVMDRDVAGAVTHIGEVPALVDHGDPVGFAFPVGDDFPPLIGEYVPRISPGSVGAGAFLTDAKNKYTVSTLQRRGSVRILGVVQGEESFADINGNKVHDEGEPFVDLGEPFVDKNDNGYYDDCQIGGLPFGYPRDPVTHTPFPVTVAHTSTAPSPVTLTDQDYYDCVEDFVDMNGNGVWDPPNGQWDNYTAIWKSTTVTWIDVPRVSLYPDLTNGQVIATNAFSDDMLDNNTGRPKTTLPNLVTAKGSAANQLQAPTNFKYTGLVPFHTYTVMAADENLNCEDAPTPAVNSLNAAPLTGSAITSSDPGRGGCFWSFSVQDSASTPRDVNPPTSSADTKTVSGLKAAVTIPMLGYALEKVWSVAVCPIGGTQCGP